MENDSQIKLRLPQPMQDIDLDVVLRQPSLLAAVKLCISLAGLQYGKELYADLEIDKGHWTRILNGEAHFPLDKLGDLMRLCGNKAPLLWLVHHMGDDPRSLRRLESDVERENRELKQQILERDQRLDIITKFVGATQRVSA